VQVDVDKCDLPDHPTDAGDRPDTDGAVAAQDEDCPTIGLEERIRDPSRGRPHDLDDGFEVLGLGPGSIGAPGNDPRVTEVVDREASSLEQLAQSGGAEGGRGLFLAYPAGAGPRGSADQR
jgi:hypothetical protein